MLRSIKTEIWYEVRVQAVGDRISIKFWEAEQDEPDYWVIDLLDATLSEGALSLVGMSEIETSPVTLKKPLLLPKAPTGDLRSLRFKRRSWKETDFQIIERPEEIEVRGESARMIFSPLLDT